MEEMDGARFSKLCRDCRLLNRHFTAIDVDLIFAKTKKKASASYSRRFALRLKQPYCVMQSLRATCSHCKYHSDSADFSDLISVYIMRVLVI